MRSLAFSLFEKFAAEVAGPAYKKYGRQLYAYGTQIEGDTATEDRLVPSLRKLEHDGKVPQLNDANFVAPNATIVGDVQLGQNSSVWYSSTVLGTLPIKIGNNTVIQDRAHITRETTIGDYVFVGPNSVIQGANIGNRAFVGMGSTVRHATLQNGSVVAGGAVILDNVTIKSNQLWAGNPAQYVRDVTPTQRQIMRQYLQEAQVLAKIHEQQTSKSFRDILTDEQTVPIERIEQYIAQNIDNWDLPSDVQDWNFIEQRILMKESVLHKESRVSQDPYQQDVSKFPEQFHLGNNNATFGQVRTKLAKEPNWNSKNVEAPYKQKI